MLSDPRALGGSTRSQAMKTPTTRTLCATIPSAHYCVIACRKPVPPWPHNRRYHAVKTASHAPRSPARGRWCWWIHFSPPIATHLLSSCSMSMTPRTGPRGDRKQPVTTPIMAAIAFCRCPAMKVSQAPYHRPFQGQAFHRCPAAGGAQTPGQAAASRPAPHPVDGARGQPRLSRGEAVDRSPSRSQLCDRIDQPCVACKRGRGRWSHRPNEPMGAMGHDHPRPLDVIPSRDVVASRRVVIKVAVSDQGVTTRFVVTDMEHARTQVVYRHSPVRGTNGKRDERSPTLPDIGSYVLPSLRGEPVAVVAAFGRLRVPRYTTP